MDEARKKKPSNPFSIDVFTSGITAATCLRISLSPALSLRVLVFVPIEKVCGMIQWHCLRSLASAPIKRTRRTREMNEQARKNIILRVYRDSGKRARREHKFMKTEKKYLRGVYMGKQYVFEHCVSVN